MLNGVFIIPTGLGCRIGGDAGANAQVRLIAACCDRLVVNPNAVNASDMNEMPANCLYVEGAAIDAFLAGTVDLKPVKTRNRILVAVNRPVAAASINAVNAGAHVLGAPVDIVELDTPLVMTAGMNTDGTAGGTVAGVVELVRQLRGMQFDALAVHTRVDCEDGVARDYWTRGGVNPWGAVEAKMSHAAVKALSVPCAHAPLELAADELDDVHVVAPSMAPEAVSTTYLFCVLKGLHRAPHLVPAHTAFNVGSIDFLLTPAGCWGPAHRSCAQRGVPIIVVRENTTCLRSFKYPLHYDKFVFVDTYVEAAGVLAALGAGLDPAALVLNPKFKEVSNEVAAQAVAGV